MASKKKGSAFGSVTSQLAQLTRGELVQLADVVTALLGLEEGEEDHADEAPLTAEDRLQRSVEEARAGRKPARGYLEEKMINGYGPYLYLRFWQGKTLKSVYIGKAREEHE